MFQFLVLFYMFLKMEDQGTKHKIVYW